MTRAAERIWLAGALGVAIVSIATSLLHGWVPLDEGTIALSARNVMAGYLPHHDFAYPYTGALPYWHALATWVSGDSMAAPRYALFAAFAAWLPAVWTLARRFVAPPTAAALVVAGAWWSVLIYPAAMPTWYLLFITTWALVALARWCEDGSMWWLVGAGALSGLAIVIKQTGVYTLAGCALGVIALDPRAGVRRRDPLVLVLLAATGIVPALLIARRGVASGEALVIALPLVAVIVALAVREFRQGVAGHGVSGELLRAWGTLGVGALIPVTILIAWYASHDATASLMDGVIGGGLLTAGTIHRALPNATVILGYGVPVATITLLFGLVRHSMVRAIAGAVCALAVCAAASYLVPAYRGIWYFAMLVVPAGAVLASWRGAVAVRAEPGMGLLLAVAAAVSLLALNQFPYAGPNYFGYVAPLAIMLAAFLAAGSSGDAGAVAGSGSALAVVRHAARSPFVLVLLLVFGGWYHRIGSVHTVGYRSVWSDNEHRLAGAHAGLYVTRSDSTRYARVTELIAAHGGGEALLAGPELPELYVLAGTQRLVPQPYLLAPVADVDSTMMAAAIDTSRVRVVAINDAPLFLPRVGAAARDWLAVRYPNAMRVDHIEVRWR